MARMHQDSLFKERAPSQRERTPTLVDVSLDEHQRAAIELPESRAMLVLGEAGYGKSTVLLHRVAHLFHRATKRPFRAAVIVPSEGLVRLMQPLLPKLGVDVTVTTYDQFAAQQARRAFRRLPRESESTPPSVMRLKRSVHLCSALKTLASRPLGVVDDDQDSPLPRGRALATRGDLQHLFGDRILITSVARAAALPDHTIEAVLDRTRIQFSQTTERQWSHVTDKKRLIAVDGRRIDDGTATEHASTIDVEDYAVLFELDRLRAVKQGHRAITPHAYDLIAIDEAQELAPLELSLIGRSLGKGGSLIVAGDAEQQTDSASSFVDWETSMRALRAPDYTTIMLEIGYRCSEDVTSLAHALRNDGQRAKARVHTFQSEKELVDIVGPQIARLLEHDPRSSVAIICRQPLTARRMGSMLHTHIANRVVFDGRFLARGAQVTIVTEVKGLEFDYVVVPDANADHWPAQPDARRAMYVAVTRAREQVVLACTGTGSPLFEPRLA